MKCVIDRNFPPNVSHVSIEARERRRADLS
jgi:hypothetical protein